MSPIVESVSKIDGRGEAEAAADVVREVCPVCGAPPRSLASTEPKHARFCDSCKHSFIGILPTPQELAALYETYGYDEEAGRYSPPFLDVIIGELLESFAPYRRTNNILDVGFGAGGLLRVAKSRGWHPHGVELSAAAVAYGRERNLGTLYEGDFLTLPLDENAFDVLVMSELIEHLVDPMPFLRRSAELLRPGGLLFMTTPHGRGISGRVLGADWSVLRPPEHLQLFSIESMRRSVKKAGFSRVEIYTQGVLPHELVAKLRRHAQLVRQLTSSSRRASGNNVAASKPATSSSTNDAGFPERARKSVDFNEQLSQRRLGRALKSTANSILKLTSLGDSLRVRAER